MDRQQTPRWLNPRRFVHRWVAPAGSYLIWLGDLNYRIPMPAAQVKEMVAAKKFAKLLKADQVRLSRCEQHKQRSGATV